MLASLNRLKLRLQFTGWLQYLPIAALALAWWLVAAAAGLLGSRTVAVATGGFGTLLLTALVFDLVTVKLRLHPRELRPRRNGAVDAFDLMRARRSCRSFQDRCLTSADHAELMASVHRHSSAPCSDAIGAAPIRFEYARAPLTVWPVVGANEFLVAIAPSAYDRRAVIDVGRTLQKVVIDATRMGLATCWIGPGADRTSVARHLGDRYDPNRDHVVCVCAVGYASRYKPLFLRFMQRLQRQRLPLSALFFGDPAFQQPLAVEAPPFARFGRCYEVCRWAPSSFNAQTTRCVAATERSGAKPNGAAAAEPRLVRFDFYATTDSRWYAPVALGIWCANWELGCAALGIRGRFAVLSAAERGVRSENDRPHLPRYDVSWVPDASGPPTMTPSAHARTAGERHSAARADEHRAVAPRTVIVSVVSAAAAPVADLWRTPMQWHNIAAKWELFMLSARSRWPRITLREFALLAGDRTRLLQKLHAVYDLGIDDADDEIARWQESLAALA